jgi:hypothetical protein
LKENLTLTKPDLVSNATSHKSPSLHVSGVQNSIAAIAIPAPCYLQLKVIGDQTFQQQEIAQSSNIDAAGTHNKQLLQILLVATETRTNIII